MNPLLILASLGPRIITSLAGSILSQSKNPTLSKLGKDISVHKDLSSLDDVDLPQQIELRREEIKAQLKSKQIDSDNSTEVNQTYRKEIVSQDRFVRWWRPAFGWTLGLCLMFELALIPLIKITAIIYNPEISSELEVVLGSPADRQGIWFIALSVLGINVTSRTRDKIAHRTGKDPTSIIRSLFNRN